MSTHWNSVHAFYIARQGNFDLGLFPMVTDCAVSAFRLPTLGLNHVMFCLQSHQFIVQHNFFKNVHTEGKKINQYHTHIGFVILYLSPNCPLLNPLISPNKVREMVTHLGTHLFKRITPM